MDDTINFDDNNDEFNPDLNYEDQEAMQNVARMKKAFEWDAKKEQQEKIKKTTEKIFKDAFNEACEETGLAPSEMQGFLNQLSIENPQAMQEFFKGHIKEYWRTIGQQGKVRARDPKTGQFIKAQPQGRPQPQGGRQPMTQPQPQSNEALARVKEKAYSGKLLTEEDELSILEGLL